MSTIEVPVRALERWCANRKMNVQDITAGIDTSADALLVSPSELRDLAKRLSVPISEIMAESDDLDEGIKIGRAQGAFRRTSIRNGKPYYTYRHLVTTSTLPRLMPLLVTVHCQDEEEVVLNGGHEPNEVVYVLGGRVRMHWDGAERRHVELEPGDSVYIKPGVSHSFMAVGGDAELVALNF